MLDVYKKEMLNQSLHSTEGNRSHLQMGPLRPFSAHELGLLVKTKQIQNKFKKHQRTKICLDLKPDQNQQDGAVRKTEQNPDLNFLEPRLL